MRTKSQKTRWTHTVKTDIAQYVTPFCHVLMRWPSPPSTPPLPPNASLPPVSIALSISSLPHRTGRPRSVCHGERALFSHGWGWFNNWCVQTTLSGKRERTSHAPPPPPPPHTDSMYGRAPPPLAWGGLHKPWPWETPDRVVTLN